MFCQKKEKKSTKEWIDNQTQLSRVLPSHLYFFMIVITANIVLNRDPPRSIDNSPTKWRPSLLAIPRTVFLKTSCCNTTKMLVESLKTYCKYVLFLVIGYWCQYFCWKILYIYKYVCIYNLKSVELLTDSGDFQALLRRKLEPKKESEYLRITKLLYPEDMWKYLETGLQMWPREAKVTEV